MLCSTHLHFYTFHSHIDIPFTSFLAVGFSRALDLLAAFQPLPPEAASCVVALEDEDRGYPALPLPDREILAHWELAW